MCIISGKVSKLIQKLSHYLVGVLTIKREVPVQIRIPLGVTNCHNEAKNYKQEK